MLGFSPVCRIVCLARFCLSMNVCLKRLIICVFIALTEQSAGEGFVSIFAVFRVVELRRFGKIIAHPYRASISVVIMFVKWFPKCRV